jgi:hypothetical protein
MKINNPFSFGVIVEGESFCNRETETARLVKYCENSQNVMIYSPRRYGKTSLLNRVFKTLDVGHPDIKKFHIDLYGILTEKQFISNVFRSFSQVESKTEKLIDFSKNIFRAVKLNFSFDPNTGSPTMTPSFQPNDTDLVLEEAMKVPETYSKNNKAVVLFDEFQEVQNFKDPTFEKRLRKIIQKHRNICYVFMGSQKHILTRMFNDPNSAFYQSADHYPLKKIKTTHYLKWIKGLYAKYGKKSPSDSMIKDVIVLCENHPMYMQQFFYHLWDENHVTQETLKAVESRVISQNQDEFLVLWENLTINQRKTLQLIILSQGKNIYYADVISQTGLQNPAQVKTALEFLIRKDIVIKNGRYQVQNILFKKWIQRLM